MAWFAGTRPHDRRRASSSHDDDDVGYDVDVYAILLYSHTHARARRLLFLSRTPAPSFILGARATLSCGSYRRRDFSLQFNRTKLYRKRYLFFLLFTFFPHYFHRFILVIWFLALFINTKFFQVNLVLQLNPDVVSRTQLSVNLYEYACVCDFIHVRFFPRVCGVEFCLAILKTPPKSTPKRIDKTEIIQLPFYSDFSIIWTNTKSSTFTFFTPSHLTSPRDSICLSSSLFSSPFLSPTPLHYSIFVCLSYFLIRLFTAWYATERDQIPRYTSRRVPVSPLSFYIVINLFPLPLAPSRTLSHTDAIVPANYRVTCPVARHAHTLYWRSCVCRYKPCDNAHIHNMADLVSVFVLSLYLRDYRTRTHAPRLTEDAHVHDARVRMRAQPSSPIQGSNQRRRYVPIPPVIVFKWFHGASPARIWSKYMFHIICILRYGEWMKDSIIFQ